MSAVSRGTSGAARLLLLAGLWLAGCSAATTTAGSSVPASSIPEAAAGQSVPADSPQPTLDPIASQYGFPAQIDPAARYLFYLHGRIIEDQGLHAVSPEFGEYQYEAILDALASNGFVVISEQRPKDADAWQYATKVDGQVKELITAGVPPAQITVVGASKGASIATAASYLLANPGVNYVLLGTCHPTLLEDWRAQGVTLSGNVLAIYDVADTEYSGSCDELFVRSEGKGLGRHSELVLQVGTGHGVLYQPLDEWVIPTVRWANRQY